jgi:hypothetical protein
MSDIDVTDLVEALRSGFVTWALEYLFALTIATPGLTWLALPIISSIYRGILRALLNWLSGAAAMEAFFLNTALKKSGQAQDFVDAVNRKHNLPANVSDEEYAKYEQAEIAAFSDFVRIG